HPTPMRRTPTLPTSTLSARIVVRNGSSAKVLSCHDTRKPGKCAKPCAKNQMARKILMAFCELIFRYILNQLRRLKLLGGITINGWQTSRNRWLSASASMQDDTKLRIAEIERKQKAIREKLDRLDAAFLTSAPSTSTPTIVTATSCARSSRSRRRTVTRAARGTRRRGHPRVR